MTETARAVEAMMKMVDRPVYLEAIRTRAVNSGWVGSRTVGCWDVKTCDAIAIAAVDGVLDLFRKWAAEPDMYEDSEPDTDHDGLLYGDEEKSSKS